MSARDSGLDLAMLDSGGLDAEIAGTQFAGAVRYLPTTRSTNAEALAAAAEGAAGGVWVADEQTAGRGRGGHAWHSAAGDGLYVSVLVRPRLQGGDALKLSLAAGLAAKAAVEEAVGVTLDIRWPNDLIGRLSDGVERKVGGILTECAMDGGDGALAYAVIGIGMNLNQAEMPEELREIAASLRMIAGGRVDRLRVLGALLRELDGELAKLEQEPAAALMERFGRASTWVHGLSVSVEEEGGYTGVTDGLNKQGLLRVRLADGVVRTVRVGGVRRIRSVDAAGD